MVEDEPSPAGPARLKSAPSKIRRSTKQRAPASESCARVSRQPTFTRYVFELPEFIAVNADRAPDKLNLMFDGKVRFDLADAKVLQPPMVASVDTKSTDTSTAVTISFIGRVDVRSFREDNNFVVDIVTSDGAPSEEFRVFRRSFRALRRPRLERG